MTSVLDTAVRAIGDIGPDLDWHGPGLAVLPVCEPESADVAWIDEPCPVVFIDAERAADWPQINEEAERREAEREARLDSIAEERGERRAEDRAERYEP